MFFCCCCPFNTLWFHSIQITQLSTVRGSEPWTITTRSLAVLPHSAYRLSLAFFLLLADLNLGPLPRQPCLFPQMLMKKVVNLKIRLQKCVRILQSPLCAPAILPPHLPTIWKDSQDWHSVRERFSPKIWHSGKQRTEREPAFRCYQVSWEPCAPPLSGRKSTLLENWRHCSVLCDEILHHFPLLDENLRPIGFCNSVIGHIQRNPSKFANSV